jgi:hypothetical protein
MRCYMRHLRTARICSSGARDWWKRHGFDWSDFLANGIPAETLLETGDPFALRVVEIAREEHDGQV